MRHNTTTKTDHVMPGVTNDFFGHKDDFFGHKDVGQDDVEV